MCLDGHTAEGEEQQVEVTADETSSVEKQEETSSEPAMPTQTMDEHSKLKSLINSTINEKLEQIQVLTSLC